MKLHDYNRPTIHETMMRIANILAMRGTCYKLQVGCVLVDRQGRILSTGYNGVHRGAEHCRVERSSGVVQMGRPCPGVGAPEGSDLCQAVHAETNALLQCQDVDLIYACYTTYTPCVRCVKELLNTGCEVIYFYGYAGEGWEKARDLWEHSPARRRRFQQLQLAAT